MFEEIRSYRVDETMTMGGVGAGGYAISFIAYHEYQMTLRQGQLNAFFHQNEMPMKNFLRARDYTIIYETDE